MNGVRRLLACLLVAGCGVGDSPPTSKGLAVSAVAVRGHRDALEGAAGRLTPLFVGAGRPVGLCVAAPPTVDTSSWRGRLWLASGGASSLPPSEPVVRLRSTLCFERQVDFPSARAGDGLCGDLVDAFDGSRLDLGCREVALEPDETEYGRHLDAMRALFGAGDSSPTELVRALDELGEQARRSGSLFLPLRFELVAVYYLRREGSPRSLVDARGRLAGLPAWLDDPVASLWSAQAAQDRAVLAMMPPGRLREAWEELATAEAAYRTIAHEKWFTVSMRKAELLARLGATREAVDVLAAGLEHCAGSACEEALLPAARGSLAWMILLDAEASPARLEMAGAITEATLTEMQASDAPPLEVANQRINLAYQKVRSGRSPDLELVAARTSLARAADGRRKRQLGDWSDLVAAEGALAKGDASRAQLLCSSVAGRSGEPRLVARATSCSGRSERLHGDLEAASRLLDDAMRLHEGRTAADDGLSVPLGSGQRAEVFLEAARVEVERGRPQAAWRILERLDELATAESVHRACAGGEDAEWSARRRRIEAELAALDQPASAARRDQRRSIRRSLQSELQILLRSRPGCPQPEPAGRDREIDYRAFALDDEVILLAQDAGGGIAVARRTALPRDRLLRAIGEAEAAMAARQPDDPSWRQLLQPLSEALLPRAIDGLDRVTTFALHGALQRVPLAALPIAEADWLADRTTVALRPVAVRSARPAAVVGAVVGGRRVFAVDPQRNLPSGRRLEALYRQLYPDAEVLTGAQATVGEVGSALAAARWLHVDAHARYDPAFPELSTLELADGSLGLFDLSVSSAAELANLSGCRTGSWPTSPDSGRYGLGGWLASAGVDWIVASRADLTDRAAARFNEGFYRALAAGEPPEGAYETALGGLRQSLPASEWAALLLLRGSATGQSERQATPDEIGGELRASQEMDHG